MWDCVREGQCGVVRGKQEWGKPLWEGVVVGRGEGIPVFGSRALEFNDHLCDVGPLLHQRTPLCGSDSV